MEMSKRQLVIALSLVIGLLFQSMVLASDGRSHNSWPERFMHRIKQSNNVTEFAAAEIFLEQNATDGDTEVVLKAKGGDIGIKHFWVFSPTGKLIYIFHSPNNRSNIGGREIVVESPEPADLTIVLDAYPEGAYTYIGKAFDGQWLLSAVELVHDIPPPVSISFPPADGAVSRYEFDIVWESQVVAETYLIELKNEATEIEMQAQASGDQTSFRAPEEWLVPGSEYQVSVGIVDTNGNVTFIEQSTFTLAE
jgi:hypothetical protein